MSTLDNDIDEPVGPFVEEEGAISQATLLEAVKQEYEQLAKATDTYIPVIGYSASGLNIRYRLPHNGKELDAIATKVFRQVKSAYERNINVAIDTLITLCIGLYIEHPDKAGEYVEFNPDNQDGPITFIDTRLAEVLGWENITNARQAVRRLFANNEMALLSHADKLGRWMTDTSADLTTEVWQLGE